MSQILSSKKKGAMETQRLSMNRAQNKKPERNVNFYTSRKASNEVFQTSTLNYQKSHLFNWRWKWCNGSCKWCNSWVSIWCHSGITITIRYAHSGRWMNYPINMHYLWCLIFGRKMHNIAWTLLRCQGMPAKMKELKLT